MIDDIILYSAGCPKCKILENKLKAKNISYETITDKDEMLKRGLTEVPILKIKNKLLGFFEANNWINKSG